MEGSRIDVLMVEDDANDVAVALRAFRRHSLEDRVCVLRDGAELVDYLQTHDLRVRSPKVILLDLKMPRLDGRGALRELRSRPETRNIPVVMVSSSNLQSDVRDCYELGANSFVVKQLGPLSPGTYLVDTVRYWLELNEATS
ncbi:MAG: putative two-component response regulator [Deltaproteobacteria bacterium]|nr:putative two-component response regulator [Deltaproteobacteria bacterium]